MMPTVGKNDTLSNSYNTIKDIILKNLPRKRKPVKKVKYVFKSRGVQNSRLNCLTL